MTPLAHVGALPVEELATWLLTGGVTVIGALCALVGRLRGGHLARGSSDGVLFGHDAREQEGSGRAV